MPVSFAPARSPARSPIVRALAPRPLGVPANDDADRIGASEETLHAALRYFAVHGLGAARAAQAEAERALLGGDPSGADAWLTICRTLDKRLADDFERRRGRHAHSRP